MCHLLLIFCKPVELPPFHVISKVTKTLCFNHTKQKRRAFKIFLWKVFEAEKGRQKFTSRKVFINFLCLSTLANEKFWNRKNSWLIDWNVNFLHTLWWWLCLWCDPLAFKQTEKSQAFSYFQIPLSWIIFHTRKS